MSCRLSLTGKRAITGVILFFWTPHVRSIYHLFTWLAEKIVASLELIAVQVSRATVGSSIFNYREHLSLNNS